jgi:pyruvate dehydrogenase E2 component (dihydrolipoamide acetyltransferase)
MTERNLLQPVPAGSGNAETPPAERVALNMIQKTAGKRMLQSAREIPQFSVCMELDADRLGAWRSRINSVSKVESEQVSVTGLLIWLVARTLMLHPRLNARFDEEAVLQHKTVNMAVAVDTREGLVVPVIREAEKLSVYETAAALRDLTARAAAKRLSLNDFANATFTISNLGMLGVKRFTPLINPPQAAIMGVGAAQYTLQKDADGHLNPRRMIEVTVTADHRILDGAQVARFLRSLQENMGNDSGADAVTLVPEKSEREMAARENFSQ